MAKYRITAPDGNAYEITAPDDATEDQVLAYAQQNYSQSQGADFSNVKSGSSSTSSAKPRGSTDTGIGRLISGKPQQRGDAVTRALGDLGGRQVLQGTLGTFGALGGDAVNQTILAPIDRAIGWGDQLGVGDRTYREAASDLADRLGMAAPQTSSERVMSDVAEGVSGTAATMGLGSLLNASRSAVSTAAPTIRSRIADLLTAQPKLQIASTVMGSGAGSAARESGAGTGGQLLAGIAGGLAPGAVSTGGAAALRGLVRGSSGEGMQQQIANFGRLGTTPSVGQASGNRAIQGVENLLGGAPTSAGAISRFAEGQADDIGSGLRNLADSTSPRASAERAGRAVEQGVETFGRNTRATKKALYWQADKFIPDTTPVPLSNTWQAVVDLTTPSAGATATTGSLINPRIAQLRDNLSQDLAAGGGQISYEALKRIRTDIGETISDFSLSPDTPTRELRRMYAALSKDMEAAAQSQGPQAAQAAKRANTYTAAVANRLEQIQRVVDKNGGPEKVFSAVMSGTRDGGTTLRAVMQSLPQDGQKAITSAVIKRMGMANPGAQDAAGEAFSAQTFLTNWNKVSPEARRALFDRYGPSFSKHMDRIAKVAENIRDGSKVYANPSGTANRAAALTYGGALVASLFDPSLVSTGGLVSGGIGANWLARKLTDPAFVQLLANSTAFPTGSIVSQINALRQLGEKQDDEETIAVADALAREHSK